MFNDRYGLTQAVLKGRKTMTRRSVNLNRVHTIIPGRIAECYLKYAPYKVGETVAVAQNYKDVIDIGGLPHPLVAKPGWTNKMYVRADLMPHQIRITNVRVERLQDISDEDCLREGVWKDEAGGRVIGYPFGVPFFNTFDGAVNKETGKQLHWTTPREAFAALIDKVSGKDTWKSNPWVFVYEFELVK